MIWTTPLSPRAELNVVRFSVDGTDYTLDVSADNAARFRELLNPYVEKARICAPAPAQPAVVAVRMLTAPATAKFVSGLKSAALRWQAAARSRRTLSTLSTPHGHKLFASIKRRPEGMRDVSQSRRPYVLSWGDNLAFTSLYPPLPPARLAHPHTPAPFPRTGQNRHALTAPNQHHARIPTCGGYKFF